MKLKQKRKNEETLASADNGSNSMAPFGTFHTVYAFGHHHFNLGFDYSDVSLFV